MAPDIEGSGALSMSARPMRDLVLLLPRLEVGKGLAVDYAGTDAALLLQLCENAEVTMATILLGISSVSMLLANATPEVETGEIAPNAIEAIANLLGELAEVAAACHCLAAAGRRYVENYQPDVGEVVEGVRL
jgi:hypothetical protein